VAFVVVFLSVLGLLDSGADGGINEGSFGQGLGRGWGHKLGFFLVRV